MSTTPFRPTRLLVTGGAGFIGSAVVRAVLARGDAKSWGSAPTTPIGAGLRPARLESHLQRVVVLDAFTYAGHEINLAGLESDARYTCVRGDICDRSLVEKLFREHAFDSVLHLAAESHVDRSIESAEAFVRTNVNGTFA